jgi:hypothetical protein
MSLRKDKVPKPNHILHIILITVTGLLWLPIYITVGICYEYNKTYEDPTPNHIIHILLCFMTGFIWLPIYMTVRFCDSNYMDAY